MKGYKNIGLTKQKSMHIDKDTRRQKNFWNKHNKSPKTNQRKDIIDHSVDLKKSIDEQKK